VKCTKNGAHQSFSEKDERGCRWTTCSWLAISPFSPTPVSVVPCTLELLCTWALACFWYQLTKGLLCILLVIMEFKLHLSHH